MDLSLEVELLSLHKYDSKTGIGRYVQTLQQNLQPLISVKRKRLRFSRLSKGFSLLRNLPLGIEGHERGGIVHFTQIMGCGMMLWKPYHPSVATVHGGLRIAGRVENA